MSQGKEKWTVTANGPGASFRAIKMFWNITVNFIVTECEIKHLTDF